MQSHHSEILTSFSGREIKTHNHCYVDCVIMDSEMIANCGIKCNTLKQLHEIWKKKKKKKVISTRPLQSKKKENELKTSQTSLSGNRSNNPSESWIHFSLAANSFKEWLGLFSVNVFLFLRGCDTLSFFKIFNLIVMDLFCRGIRNMTTKFWTLLQNMKGCNFRAFSQRW